MTASEYDALTNDERYDLLHRIFDDVLDLITPETVALGRGWIPTPDQIAHCSFSALPEDLRKIISRLDSNGARSTS